MRAYRSSNLWKPLLAFVAALLLLVSVFGMLQKAGSVQSESSPSIRTMPSDQPSADAGMMGAVATNGKLGYIYRKDLDAATRVAREEVDASGDSEAARQARSVPVYESDGVTQIGEYVVG